MPTPLLLAALLVLAPQPPGPDIDLPAELDICILTAEVCALDAIACDANGDRNACIKHFSICIEPFKIANAPSCRMDYAMCRLLSSPADTLDQIEHCAMVVDQCPTILPYP